MSQDLTRQVLAQHLEPENWTFASWASRRGRNDINRLSPMLALPLGPLRKLRPGEWQHARSCNLAVWRPDLDRVDGFDADYNGWGREDSDLLVRLLHAGVRRKDGNFATGVLHLWHPAADRSALPDNDQKLDRGSRRKADQGPARDVVVAPRRSERRPQDGGCAIMTFTLKPNAAQRESLMRIADGLVVGIALALPWSTSATVILICLWVVTVLPTIEPETLKQEMTRPAAFLPVALFVFATIGMLWSPVRSRNDWRHRFFSQAADHSVTHDPVSPLRPRHLGHGSVSGIGNVAARGSAGAPFREREGWGLAKGYGLPVKDYIAQSAIFTVCAFGLFYLAIDAFRLRWRIFGTVFSAVRTLLFICRPVFRDHKPHRAAHASVSPLAAWLPAIRLKGALPLSHLEWFGPLLCGRRRRCPRTARVDSW
jgi:hypothetical protein